jgi:hypothetical protein
MTTVRFLIAFFVLAAQPLFSQPDETQPTAGYQKPNANVVNTIERFKNTDFMVKILTLRSQIEEEARDFVAHRNRYTRQDVRKIQLGYERTAGRFNQVMLDIKQDFMDKNKLKMIKNYPQTYSESMTTKINSLDQFYAENMQQPLTLLTEKDGSAILGVLIELIKASGELSSYFKNIKYEKNAMSEEYINKTLIAPMRFTSWQELVNTTPINNDDTGNGGNNGGNNDTGNGGNNGGNNDTGNGGNNGGNNDTGNGGNNGGNNDTGNGGNNDNGGGGNSGSGNGENNNTNPNTNVNKTNKSKKSKVNPDASVIELDDSSVIKPKPQSGTKKTGKDSTTKKKQQ